MVSIILQSYPSNQASYMTMVRFWPNAAIYQFCKKTVVFLLFKTKPGLSLSIRLKKWLTRCGMIKSGMIKWTIKYLVRSPGIPENKRPAVSELQAKILNLNPFT